MTEEQQRIYRIVVISLIIFFAIGLFLMARFLRTQLKTATQVSEQALTEGASAIDMEAYKKVIHRFE